MTSSYTVSAYDIYDKLNDLVKDQAEWSQQTFGSDAERGPLGPLKHLAKETEEVIANPGNIEEYADCFLLLLDALRRAKFKFGHLLDAAQSKMKINRARKWPVPQHPDEPVEHIE